MDSPKPEDKAKACVPASGVWSYIPGTGNPGGPTITVSGGGGPGVICITNCTFASNPAKPPEPRKADAEPPKSESWRDRPPML